VCVLYCSCNTGSWTTDHSNTAPFYPMPHIHLKGLRFLRGFYSLPFVLLLRATCVKMSVECWRNCADGGKRSTGRRICLSGHTFLIQIRQTDCWVQAASRLPGAGGCFARVEQPVSEGNNCTFSPLYAFIAWIGTSLPVPVYR